MPKYLYNQQNMLVFVFIIQFKLSMLYFFFLLLKNLKLFFNFFFLILFKQISLVLEYNFFDKSRDNDQRGWASSLNKS